MNSILDTFVEKYRKDIIEKTSQLIQIPSMKDAPLSQMPFGEPIAACLNQTLELCASLGMRTKNCGGYAGWAEIGDGQELCGILVHLDVVPGGGGWHYPPFGGQVKDGKLFGRGAIDDKGPAVASIYALKAIADSQLPLRRRIRIIFGTDEENDWNCMDYYKEHEEIPSLGFSPDAEFPVIFAEKGILFATVSADGTLPVNPPYIQSLTGGRRANMVPDECVAEIVLPDSNSTFEAAAAFRASNISGTDITYKDNILTIRTSGVTAHGSTPEKGLNAISKMMEFLSGFDMEDSFQKKFIDFYQSHIGFETDGTSMTGAIVSDVPSGSLVLNAGLISMDTTCASLKLNIRYPVTYTGKKIQKYLENTVLLEGLNIDIDLNSEPLYQEKESPIVKTLLSVYHSYCPDGSSPLAVGGGTYARSIPNSVAFGPVLPGREELAHCPDEFISVEDLILSAKIYAQAMLCLAGEESRV